MSKVTIIRWILTVLLIIWVCLSNDLLGIKFCLVMLTLSNEMHAYLWAHAAKKGHADEADTAR